MTDLADDERTFITTLRGCEPADRQRLLEHARTCVSLAGRPRRSLDELLAEIKGAPRQNPTPASDVGPPAAPRFCVVRDEDGHSYLVPAERRAEAVAALEACGRFWDVDTTDAYRDAHDGDAEPPDWMRRIAGAAVLTFADPREDA